MKKPCYTEGGSHTDSRGTLCFNNNFDASAIKRFYTITNADLSFKRGWTGHTIERRWFSAIAGAFEIRLIKIDVWEQPNPALPQEVFQMTSEGLHVLEVPSGYVTSIQALQPASKLLVMSDYLVGETKDEKRFESTYFSEN